MCDKRPPFSTPSFDSFRPGEPFDIEEFRKMLESAEHDICPMCGQVIHREEEPDADCR